MQRILGAVCGGGILKGICTEERAHGHLSFRKRTALFNIEELHGESQIYCFSTACSVVVRERNMLWRFSLVNRMWVCSCVLCMYSYIFKFSPKVFADSVGNLTCFWSIKYWTCEPFRNSQVGNDPTPSLRIICLAITGSWKCFLGCVKINQGEWSTFFWQPNLSSSKNRCRETCSCLPGYRGHCRVTLRLWPAISPGEPVAAVPRRQDLWAEASQARNGATLQWNVSTKLIVPPGRL